MQAPGPKLSLIKKKRANVRLLLVSPAFSFKEIARVFGLRKKNDAKEAQVTSQRRINIKIIFSFFIHVL